MQKTFTLLGAVCAPLLLASAVFSQEQNAPAPTPIVEIYACNFNNNKDMNDLHSVTTRWNAWADRNTTTDYTAFIGTPYLRSDDQPWDAIWLGGWPNGAAMGAGEAKWFATGGDIQAQFDAVAKCPSHAHYAELVLWTPEGPPPKNGMARFRDCHVREGRTIPEAIAALRQWGQYLADHGSKPFGAMLVPLEGLPADYDYDFKYVEGFDSIEALGHVTDVYTGGGFMRADQLFGRLLDCNHPRVYGLELVRQAAQQQ